MTTQNYQPSDRRPIASRDAKLSKTIASRLARTGVTPNAISVTGMVLAIFGGILLGLTSGEAHDRWFWLVAAFLIQGRLLANMFDGMVAIETGRASPVGEIYNELPDRFSDAALLIGAGYAWGGQVQLGYIAALLAVLTAYVRALGGVAGAKQQFCGPMAKPQRMFLMTLLCLYHGLTPRSWQPAWDSAWFPGLAAAALALIILGALITVWQRLGRIAKSLTKDI